MCQINPLLPFKIVPMTGGKRARAVSRLKGTFRPSETVALLLDD